jgi:hypothetical protein
MKSRTRTKTLTPRTRGRIARVTSQETPQERDPVADADEPLPLDDAAFLQELDRRHADHRKVPSYLRQELVRGLAISLGEQLDALEIEVSRHALDGDVRLRRVLVELRMTRADMLSSTTDVAREERRRRFDDSDPSF